MRMACGCLTSTTIGVARWGRKDRAHEIRQREMMEDGEECSKEQADSSSLPYDRESRHSASPAFLEFRPGMHRPVLKIVHSIVHAVGGAGIST